VDVGLFVVVVRFVERERKREKEVFC
jgi:hypothetical protein